RSSHDPPRARRGAPAHAAPRAPPSRRGGEGGRDRDLTLDAAPPAQRAASLRPAEEGPQEGATPPSVRRTGAARDLALRREGPDPASPRGRAARLLPRPHDPRRRDPRRPRGDRRADPGPARSGVRVPARRPALGAAAQDLPGPRLDLRLLGVPRGTGRA